MKAADHERLPHRHVTSQHDDGDERVSPGHKQKQDAHRHRGDEPQGAHEE